MKWECFLQHIVSVSSPCLQLHLRSHAGGPAHDRHHMDHVPEACGALGPEESPQLGENSFAQTSEVYLWSVLFFTIQKPVIAGVLTGQGLIWDNQEKWRCSCCYNTITTHTSLFSPPLKQCVLLIFKILCTPIIDVTMMYEISRVQQLNLKKWTAVAY